MEKHSTNSLLSEKNVAVQVSKTLELNLNSVKATLKLLSEGGTIPFIARYRKEATGNLDEVIIHNIEIESKKVVELLERKKYVLTTIQNQLKLTPDLSYAIEKASNLQDVEDLYLPFKKKRQTKATIARENGLQPLADYILKHMNNDISVQQYISKNLTTREDVIKGVIEILAEFIGEKAIYRQWLRTRMLKDGILVSSIKKNGQEKDTNGVYAQYYGYQETIKSLQNNKHRILALNRGEKDDILSIKIEFPESRIYHFIQSQELAGREAYGEGFDLLKLAIKESYKRFIRPAIEREIRQRLTESAQQQAIKVFGENLYHLLMQSPVENSVVMGFDPGYRTGSKLAVVDSNGKFLEKMVIYPHKPASDKMRLEASILFQELIKKYNVDLIAIGNGTASRESEEFVAKYMPNNVKYVIVSEAGASVYSASDAARKEFPKLHVEERSAISIARRVQDPLAELIKINPKAIGVGQYQHDLNSKDLDKQVDQVIERAVNKAGINLNTASVDLLENIAGLTSTLAQNIIEYRNKLGAFKSREQLKKVPRLGPKAFEQSVGFLRVVDGENIFDNTDIHPESYDIAHKLLTIGNVDMIQVKQNPSRIDLSKLNNELVAKKLNIGTQTLHDIVSSLQKYGRTGRSNMSGALLKSEIVKLEDLRQGMQLEGTVRNVVDFGAFVDIGVKQDGLVHISRLSKKRVANPLDVVAVGDIVNVWVIEIDNKRKRIALTMVPLEEKI
ncbi:helix-hairpin-helix domain-containing protein [Leuconostoc palmae]|uniref:helix-hairpin-helix domain-containing protein n=1 Tax=Leuconostoc palmae TaxID=501487 RepID=UPI001C7DDBA8|nr:Tex family protein [Leuconostoc palmae]